MILQPLLPDIVRLLPYLVPERTFAARAKNGHHDLIYMILLIVDKDCILATSKSSSKSTVLLAKGLLIFLLCSGGQVDVSLPYSYRLGPMYLATVL